MSETTQTRERRVSVESTIRADGTITLQFTSKSDPADVAVMDTAEYPQDIVTRLLEYGLRQKGGDAYADKDKYPDAVGRIREIHDMLREGDWGATRGSGGMGGTTGDLINAYAQVKGLEVSAVAEKITSILKDKENKTGREGLAKLRKHPQIAKLMAEAAAARAMAKASRMGAMAGGDLADL